MTLKISPPPPFPSPPFASGSYCCEASSAGVSARIAARISSWPVCASLSPSLNLSLSQELISLITLSSVW
jgi:hypothetical protein